MLNAIQNPGFETEPVAPWVPSGGATRSNEQALSGAWSGKLRTVFPSTGAVWSVVASLAPVQHTLVIPAIRVTGTRPLRIFLNDPDGANIFFQDISTASAPMGEWIEHQLFSFQAVAGDYTLLIFGLIPTGFGAAVWHVDDVRLEFEAPVGEHIGRRWPVLQRIASAVAAINGTGGYRTNLRGQVFMRKVAPTEQDLRVPPWACVVVNGEQGKPEVGSRGLVDLTWTLRVVGVVPVASLDPLEPGLTKPVADLHDDLLVCLEREVVSNLGGFVVDLALEPADCVADVTSRSPYGLVIFTLRLRQVLEAEQLLVN